MEPENFRGGKVLKWVNNSVDLATGVTTNPIIASRPINLRTIRKRQYWKRLYSLPPEMVFSTRALRAITIMLNVPWTGQDLGSGERVGERIPVSSCCSLEFFSWMCLFVCQVSCFGALEFFCCILLQT
jgi:hypothetical protein